MSMLMGIAAFLFVLYFAPGLVAIIRGHPQKMAIWVMNIFLGWTFIGWVGALVWAAMAFEKAEVK